MSFRSLFAAAAVVVGIGQAAEAATVVDYNLYLRYEGSSFHDYVFYDGWNSSDDISGSYYPVEDPLGLDVPNQKFPGLAVGDIVRFIATVVFPDDPYQVVTQYGNGGTAPVCSIAKTSCTDTERTIPKGPYDAFEISYSDIISISGSKQVGSAFIYSHYFPGSWTSDDGRWNYYAWYTHALFTVVEIVDTPAPVPLPATAALLPLGIGAIAMMRKRRKSHQAGTV